MKKILVLSISSLIFISCLFFGPKMPESQGVYHISNRGDYTKLNMYKGGPEGADYLNLLDTTNEPKFLFWEPYINIQLLGLYDIQNFSEYNYSYATKNNGGIEIKIEESLPSGYYCFAQGDYLASPVEIRHWCFSVGITEMRKNLEKDIKLNLSSNEQGVFVAKDGKYAPIEPINVDALNIQDLHLDNLIYVNTNFPVVSVRSDTIKSREFNLYQLRPLIGIEFQPNYYSATSEAKIDKVYQECNAYSAGLLPGDKIVGAGGKVVNTQDEAFSTLKDRLRLGTSIDLRIEREGEIYDTSIIADCFTFSEDIPLKSESISDFTILYPTLPLTTGHIYCLTNDKILGYCYGINP
jgi:hypothetical protein